MSINNIMKNAKIIFADKIYNYEQNASWINKLKSELFRLNNESNPVIIALDRTPKLIFSILTMLELSIPFVPIDLSYPQERISYIVNNSDSKLILTESAYLNQFPGLQLILIDELDNIVNIKEKENVKNELAYILYTSGTTGYPKGVEVTREGLLNLIEGVSDVIDFSSGKCIACITTVSFDIFFLESIMAIEKGLTVILASEDEQCNPKLMAKLIKSNGVNMVQMTPSRMQLLLNHDKELVCLKNIKEIMIGGEPFPLSLLRVLKEKTTAKIYNMYGLTETTIYSTIRDLTNKDYIDIGYPIKNTDIYIVDDNLNILSKGQAGEICIAGKGLARGYIGGNDMTEEKFIYLSEEPSIRVYRTGDMGRYLPDGSLEYLGRVDNQVKIHGHRIELEEIETHLNLFPGVKQSVVITKEITEIDKALWAFLTSENDIDFKAIPNYLSEKLPSYMLPVVFKQIEDFIYTTNGKIDRKRVFECVEIKSNEIVSQNYIYGEMSEIEKKVINTIISINEKSNVGLSLDMDFVSNGFDSLTFVKMVTALEDEFDFEFDVEMLYTTKFPTIRTIIEYVKSEVK